MNPEKKYSVLLAPEGKQIALLSGQQIYVEGFKVSFLKEYDGEIIEIREN